MKLTEQQLSKLFNSNLEHNDQAPTQAGECLAASPASSDRLLKAEQLLDDPVSAQAMKVALASKPWAEAVGNDLNKTQSWHQKLFGQTMYRWAMAGAACALVFMVSTPDSIDSVTTLHTPVIEQSAANDVINNGHFDHIQSDRLNNGGFEPIEGPKDILSDHSFG